MTLTVFKVKLSRVLRPKAGMTLTVFKVKLTRVLRPKAG